MFCSYNYSHFHLQTTADNIFFCGDFNPGTKTYSTAILSFFPERHFLKLMFHVSFKKTYWTTYSWTQDTELCSWHNPHVLCKGIRHSLLWKKLQFKSDKYNRQKRLRSRKGEENTREQIHAQLYSWPVGFLKGFKGAGGYSSVCRKKKLLQSVGKCIH